MRREAAGQEAPGAAGVGAARACIALGALLSRTEPEQAAHLALVAPLGVDDQQRPAGFLGVCLQALVGRWERFGCPTNATVSPRDLPAVRLCTAAPQRPAGTGQLCEPTQSRGQRVKMIPKCRSQQPPPRRTCSCFSRSAVGNTTARKDLSSGNSTGRTWGKRGMQRGTRGGGGEAAHGAGAARRRGPRTRLRMLCNAAAAALARLASAPTFPQRPREQADCHAHTCAWLALHPSIVDALGADGGACPQQALHQAFGQRARRVKLLPASQGRRAEDWAGREGDVGRQICSANSGAAPTRRQAFGPRRARWRMLLCTPAARARRTFCRLHG